MNLRERQQAIKSEYREDPEKARITLQARSSQLEADVMACSVDIGRAIMEAQAHAGVGGAGTGACSGDLLLGALAGCTQITAQLVAEAMGLRLESIDVAVEGDLDLRGTLGIDRTVPVGFTDIRVSLQVRGDIDAETLAAFQRRVERYCVVWQTLVHPPNLEAKIEHV